MAPRSRIIAYKRGLVGGLPTGQARVRHLWLRGLYLLCFVFGMHYLDLFELLLDLNGLHIKHLQAFLYLLHPRLHLCVILLMLPHRALVHFEVFLPLPLHDAHVLPDMRDHHVHGHELDWLRLLGSHCVLLEARH